MKDVPHLLSAHANAIHPRYEVTLRLGPAAAAAPPRSAQTEIKSELGMNPR